MSLGKQVVEDFSTPFKFDIMAQLANIPTQITLHELLHLSKETKDALHEALADLETFLTQVPPLQMKSVVITIKFLLYLT